jgi:hypothetical protein
LFTNGLANGTAGGNQGQIQYASIPIYATDLYHPNRPSGQRWTSVAPATEKRLYHSGALLTAKGTVLTMGSEFNNYDDLWTNNRQDCFPVVDRVCTDPFNYNIEEYTPPYRSLSRMTIRNMVTSVTYGSLLKIDVDQPGDQVNMISLIRMGTTTHSTNTDQRFIEAPVEHVRGNSVWIRYPRDGRMAPPGNWYVFVVDKKGGISEARTVLLGTGNRVEDPVPNHAISIQTSFLFLLLNLLF